MADQADADYTFTHGSIDRIEVENFNSHRGLQSIGPFEAFTAVIGPNGSGKSNLMDAISFVLGVRTTQLRGNLKELLYVNSLGTTEADRPRRGHVRLVFRTAGKDGQAGEEVAFTRAIQPVGSESDKYQSVYKVADKTSSWEGYSAAQGSHGILVKVRNFLVFQGDIEAIALRTPKELTALFEQISGSEALKADYERLELEHAQAEKESQLLADKKKHLTMEKRQKKEQKEEAEKHLAMLEDLRGQKAHHLLWQLYHLDRDLRSARQDKLNLEQHLQELAADNMGVDKQVEAAKKAAAGHAKENMLLEKKMKKLVTDTDKKSPSLIKVEEEIMRVTKRLKAADKDVGEVRAAVEEKVKKLEKELKLVNAAQGRLAAAGAAHYAEHDGEGGSNLRSADVQEELARLKAEAGTKTARVERDRAMLQQEQETDAQELARLRGCATQLTARADHLRGQVVKAATRRTALEANLAAARQELEEKIKRRDKLDGDRRTVPNLYEELNCGFAKIAEELASVKQHRGESARVRKLTENIAALKKLFPGVHGRLPDLGKAHQRRHHLALAVAMGRDIDTVVVEDQATVVGCIAHLKEQRLPPITFLALTTVREKPKHINERLRHLGGTAKLAVDLIQFDAAFEGAFIFALSNTLICDTAAEARVLAFGTDGERHKVVSVDGTSITQGGLMTGGGVGSLGERAARFDDKQVGEAKAKRLDLQAQLQAVLPCKAGAAADMMDVDGEEDGGGAGLSAGGDGASGSGTASAASATAAAATLGSLDSSSLKPKQLIVKDKKAVEADMWAKMDDLQTLLEHSAPNLKAVEQSEAVKQRDALQVDAALDNTNVARLVHYHRNKTRKGSGRSSQSIAISLKTDTQELARLRGCATQLTARADHLRGQVVEAATRLSTLQAKLATACQELKEKSKLRSKLDGDRRIVSSLYEMLQRDIGNIDEELSSVKQHHRESDRGRILTENVAALKKLFPGVHGRLPDLGKAHQRRHHLALAVAMGRDIDTVVVEDQATVVGCIAHLKEQRLPPITFLALTTVREKPKQINERLRHLGGTAKLALDLIQFDAVFEGAFICALSNALICDTAAEAHVLSVGSDGKRRKVVSVDGTCITQGGLMTGGGVGWLGHPAAHFDDKAIEEAKAKRLNLQAQLQVLPALRQLQEEQQLTADLVALMGRIRYIEADLKTLQEKAVKLGEEVTNAQDAAQHGAPQMDKLEAAVAVHSTEIEVLAQRANGIVDRVFATQGLTSIREFEERQFGASLRNERRKLAKKEACIEEQVSLFVRGLLHETAQTSLDVTWDQFVHSLDLPTYLYVCHEGAGTLTLRQAGLRSDCTVHVSGRLIGGASQPSQHLLDYLGSVDADQTYVEFAPQLHEAWFRTCNALQAATVGQLTAPPPAGPGIPVAVANLLIKGPPAAAPAPVLPAADALAELVAGQKAIADGLRGMQDMMASKIMPIWESQSVFSQGSSGAKHRKREANEGVIKSRLCIDCGYEGRSPLLKCQLSCLKAGSPAVRGAHIFPYAKAAEMPHLLGCPAADVNSPGNMTLLLAPLEWAFDKLYYMYVLRKGRLVARWLNPKLRGLKILDSCPPDNAQREFLGEALKDWTWGRLDGLVLQQPGVWKPLLRAFALHAAFARKEATRSGWLDDPGYLQLTEQDDCYSYASDSTPQSALALWAVAAGAADAPLVGFADWPQPTSSAVAVMCLCEPPALAVLVGEDSKCYWRCKRTKIAAKDQLKLSPCAFNEPVPCPPSAASAASSQDLGDEADFACSSMVASRHAEDASVVASLLTEDASVVASPHTGDATVDAYLLAMGMP